MGVTLPGRQLRRWWCPTPGGVGSAGPAGLKCALLVLLLLTAGQSGAVIEPLLGWGGETAPTTVTGTVAGRVIYQSDPSRPWRYARYYIQRPAKGELAETVVALRGRELAKAAPPKPAATVEMDQVDYRFVPETIAIRVGDRVTFSNSDVSVHNVRTDDGTRPFNVNTPMGGEYTHTFDFAGGTRLPIRIGCTYHSQMRAWIFVFAHPFFQVTAADGRFRLEQVPAGEYELELVHPAGALRASQRVVVMANKVTEMEITVSPDNLIEKK